MHCRMETAPPAQGCAEHQAVDTCQATFHKLCVDLVQDLIQGSPSPYVSGEHDSLIQQARKFVDSYDAYMYLLPWQCKLCPANNINISWKAWLLPGRGALLTPCVSNTATLCKPCRVWLDDYKAPPVGLSPWHHTKVAKRRRDTGLSAHRENLSKVSQLDHRDDLSSFMVALTKRLARNPVAEEQTVLGWLQRPS